MATSPQNQEQYQFAAPGEHIIRHGEAAPIREPKPLNYTGRLDSPRHFLLPKKEVADLYDPLRSTLLVNTTLGTLTLYLNEKNELGDVVSGGLSVAPELELFKINKDHRFTTQELLTLLKRLRFFFPDKEKHSAILDALQNFSATVQTKIEQSQSNTGASKNSLEREVSGIAWDREFILQVPVFKGYGAESFRVEIGVDPTSAGVKFFLDSPELFELEQNLKRLLLADEIAFFQTWGCSVIHVS